MTDREHLTTAGLPQTYSMAEVCAAFGCSDREINRLIADGKVSYLRGRRKSRRFAAEHVGQIQAALEVRVPTTLAADTLAAIGVTARSAARRRRSA